MISNCIDAVVADGKPYGPLEMISFVDKIVLQGCKCHGSFQSQKALPSAIMKPRSMPPHPAKMSIYCNFFFVVARVSSANSNLVTKTVIVQHWTTYRSSRWIASATLSAAARQLRGQRKFLSVASQHAFPRFGKKHSQSWRRTSPPVAMSGSPAVPSFISQ